MESQRTDFVGVGECIILGERKTVQENRLVASVYAARSVVPDSGG